VISVGSIDESNTTRNIKSTDGKYTFDVEYGEFSPYLTEVNKYLKGAEEHALNEN
jgi:hypothetical protein